MVRCDKYGCVRGVLDSRRNLQQAGLRDPRYLLVLRDAGHFCQLAPALDRMDRGAD
jgi:hypothetical protein